MGLRSGTTWAACVLLCSGFSIRAQRPGFHTEFSGGTSGPVVLVNDSQKPIEAFRGQGQCGSGTTPLYLDDLNTPKGVLSGVRQPSIVKPGESTAAQRRFLKRYGSGLFPNNSVLPVLDRALPR